jgi:hypothetical protein
VPSDLNPDQVAVLDASQRRDTPYWQLKGWPDPKRRTVAAPPPAAHSRGSGEEPRPARSAGPSLESSTLKKPLSRDVRDLVAPGHSRTTGLFNVTATRYPDGWRAVVFRGHDPPREVEGPRRVRSKESDDRWASAVIRAKAKVRHLCRCISADHMWTFTRRGKFADLDLLWAAWKEFCRLMAVRYPRRSWEFVAVPELHSDGCTWHLHVATHGFWDVNVLRPLWHRALGAPGLMRGSDSPGNVDAHRFVGRSARAIAGYISKYVGKGMGSVAAGRRLYSSSTGIRALEQRRFHFLCTVAWSEMHEWVGECLAAWGGGDEFECLRYGSGPAECYVFEAPS